jgi:hypothetical protein
VVSPGAVLGLRGIGWVPVVEPGARLCIEPGGQRVEALGGIELGMVE